MLLPHSVSSYTLLRRAGSSTGSGPPWLSLSSAPRATNGSTARSGPTPRDSASRGRFTTSLLPITPEPDKSQTYILHRLIFLTNFIYYYLIEALSELERISGMMPVAFLDQ